MKLTISDLMARSGVKFGTSGARGLADAITDQVCYVYTLGFLQYLRRAGQLSPGTVTTAVGGDLRPSTDRILAAVCRAVSDFGGRVVNCGKVPSPAVALHGLEHGVPAIVVTGSHIPDDRNGIKFNKPTGEILKADEAGIAAQELDLPGELFADDGAFRDSYSAPPVDPAPERAYVRRYLDVFPGDALLGDRLAVYQHSAVGRDLLVEILRGLGATVEPLGRSDRFLPVDTEAIRPEDIELAREWAAPGSFDAIVSADGDSDRPLVSDEHGEWLRGDIAGVLTARYLGADSVSTPVSSNSAAERSGWFSEVRRTRIGSPFVVESMLEAAAAGRRRVIGYEANGGFLIQSNIDWNGRILRALPTRDAVIVILSVLLLRRRMGGTVSQLVASLPRRFTASDRLKAFASEKSRAILDRFSRSDEKSNLAELDALFGALVKSPARSIDRTDGVRATFANDEVLHLRASGNAPEFRCYSEADSTTRAEQLCREALATLTSLTSHRSQAA